MDAAVAHNMDLHSRNVQLRIGVLLLGGALALAVGLLWFDVSIPVRALVFFPFFVGVHSVLSSLLGTCAFTAMRGRRMTYEGSEKMADRGEVAANRRRGARLLAATMMLSGLATTLLLVAR
jgi:hypothetical protein